MNKYFKFFAIASVAALASCSSDEPAQEQPTLKPGEAVYLNVSLRDANDLNLFDRSRAGEAETPEFVYGTENEGKVNTAYFYFFDGNGNYVGQANIWKGGTATAEPNTNIEFKANTCVVLDNLKGTDYPEYMVTVLNGTHYTNEVLAGKDLNDFAQILTSWGTNTANGFVMTSTSYYNTDDANSTNHKNAYYFATKLDKTNFARTEALALGTPAVNVYVERLAARVHLNCASVFKVNATIYGATGDNGEVSETVAATPLAIRIDGWYINGTQANSYLCKDLTGWNATSTINMVGSTTDKWNWNQPLYFRSFWGKSYKYAGLTDTDLTWTAYGVSGNAAGGYDYCNENTTSYDNLKLNVGSETAPSYLPNQQKLTSVIIKATLGTMDADGNFSTALPFVEFKGQYFTEDRFIAYVLDVVKDKIPYTRRFEGTGEGTAEADGEYIYTQLGADNFEITGTNASVNVVCKGFPEGVDLYTYNKEEYDTSLEALDELNAALEGALNGSIANMATNGAMYYNVPIEHLNKPTRDSSGNITAWGEGSYGVVRNHAYEITVNSVKRLGHAVFSPESMTDPVKPTPTPEDPNWFLGATINILSWKIVNNSVDL